MEGKSHEGVEYRQLQPAAADGWELGRHVDGTQGLHDGMVVNMGR